MSLSTSVGFKLGVDSASMDADLAKAITKVDRFAKQVADRTRAASEKAGAKATGGGAGGGGLLGGLGKGIAGELGLGGITGMATAATAAVAAIGLLGKAAVNMAGELADAADNMDINVEKLQGLQQFFGEGGVSAEKFGAAMASLSGKVQSAKEGNEDARKSLERLGIGFNDLFALSPDEMLGKIADASRDASDKGQLLADLTDVLGKSAKKMIGPLSQGSDEIERLGKETVKMSEANVKALDSLGDSFSRLWTNTKATAGNALGWMVDAVKNTTNVLKTGMDKPEWIDRTKPEPTAAQKAQADAEAKAQRQKEADAKSDRAMVEASEKNRQKMREESEKAQTALHERGMKAEEEMMKRQEEAASKQLSRHEQEKQKLADIAHMKEQMVGQDIDQQNIMRNEMLKTKEAEVGKIKARLAMTPEQRREADRAERRDQAAQRKAERIFEGKQRERDQKLARERGIDGRKVAPKDVAPAPPKAGDPADTIKRASDGFMQAVDDLRKLRVVAITNT